MRLRSTQNITTNEYIMQEAPITVMIADTHPLFRDGLKARLEKFSDFEIVGHDEDIYDILTACQKHLPRILLMDIFIPGLEGAKLIPKFQKISPKTKILVASDNEDPIDVQMVLSEGASGYILKRASSEEFVNAIRVVSRDGSYLPASLMANLISAAKKTRFSGNMFGLTTREIDILRELAIGACNKKIAKKLDISVRTVETHRQNIRQKTGAFATADLLRVAARLGITHPAM